jgi:hypothetical protein
MREPTDLDQRRFVGVSDHAMADDLASLLASHEGWTFELRLADGLD